MKVKFTWATASLYAAIACGLLLGGCELPGKGESSNRFEELNLETKKLIDVLEKIMDLETAKANQVELQAAADKVRDVQRRIQEAAAQRAEKGSGGGMAMVTNFRQASLFEQVGDAARRQKERIEENCMHAGDIVVKAMDGIELPGPSDF
jgi:hypothetical protein